MLKGLSNLQIKNEELVYKLDTIERSRSYKVVRSIDALRNSIRLR